MGQAESGVVIRKKTRVTAKIARVLSAGIATAVWGLWTAVELGFRRREAIASSDQDQGSLLALKLAHCLRLVGMLVGFLGVGRINGATAPIQLAGLGLMFAGITIRGMAIHALGVLFTGRVQIRAGHALMRTGLYSHLRHPAYAGSLVAYIGLGLAFSNWWTLACSVLPYLLALSYRIRVEEAVLQKAFGPAYGEYALTTKRIIPWVY